jgi:hypothetical protein
VVGRCTSIICTAANFCSKNAAAMAHHITDAYV